MAITLSVSEVINKAASLKTEAEQIAFLREHPQEAIKIVLGYTYDKNIKFLIPSTRPKFTPYPRDDLKSALYREYRKIKYIVDGLHVGDNLTQYQREIIFIDVLEHVDKADAEILIDMLQKKKLTGLTMEVINKAYGGIINPYTLKTEGSEEIEETKVTENTKSENENKTTKRKKVKTENE